MFDNPIDNGFFQLTERQALQLCNFELPEPGNEKLAAHEGKYYWVGRTKCLGVMVWSVRSAGSWRLVDGVAVLGGPNG